jgi:hypothetical protein
MTRDACCLLLHVTPCQWQNAGESSLHEANAPDGSCSWDLRQRRALDSLRAVANNVYWHRARKWRKEMKARSGRMEMVWYMFLCMDMWAILLPWDNRIWRCYIELHAYYCSARIQLSCLEIRIDGFLLCYCFLPRNTSLSTSAFTASQQWNMEVIIQHVPTKSHWSIVSAENVDTVQLYMNFPHLLLEDVVNLSVFEGPSGRTATVSVWCASGSVVACRFVISYCDGYVTGL